ncbi:hypothetical protein [Streptomyces sp. WMMC897]|uniref:hypothetical protein n=1 Tax=Streptomyces sp. WMMC897 TaxID=3014782 RepID=UPI0022B70E0C|nr:hypothetical protein [Streptomyces sp. WMMC897]MCZ7413028.1 hypothetical protein [Streptomyces sp. WMMC897]MCZ7413090.1 hypothetical protein [Streptomyces sp. WMMC897]MCZ7415438.1 hypothetical protein [Streptomyces sp. WMMC897]
MTTPPRGWSRAARRRAASRPVPAAPPARACDQCAERPGVHPRTDAAGVPGRVCDGCQWEQTEALNFG